MLGDKGHKGREGVQKKEKWGDVVYEWRLTSCNSLTLYIGPNVGTFLHIFTNITNFRKKPCSNFLSHPILMLVT